jgi:uncharacterized protein YdhG (YjbR/CyaY superfamily)
MKSLQEFKVLVEEEKSDYSKFDMLVRAGLANKAQLARIHRILDKMAEERPQFNNADREIMRNLFNKMVDLLANNKQVFQRTRQAVREETEEVKEAFELTEEPLDLPQDPPFVLVLKRKAIRLYPDKTKIAMYYNQKLDKYFSIPYSSSGINSPIQAEEVQEELEESVMDTLHKIVQGKQAQSVKFGNGQSRKVDHYTASAITQVHKAVNDENKKKLADMVHKSPAHFEKVASFAFSKAK